MQNQFHSAPSEALQSTLVWRRWRLLPGAVAWIHGLNPPYTLLDPFPASMQHLLSLKQRLLTRIKGANRVTSI